MKFEVRKATKNDATFIAKSIIESSRSLTSKGLFDLLFNAKDDEELLKNVSTLVTHTKKTYCHYDNFVIAHAGSENIGLLCGYEPRLGTKERLISVLDDMGIENTYESVISAYEECFGVVERHTWMLDFLIVPDSVDEFEISKVLLNKSLLTARLKGYRNVQSAVFMELTELKMMYTNLNFNVKSENRHEYFEKIFHSLGLILLELHL